MSLEGKKFFLHHTTYQQFSNYFTRKFKSTLLKLNSLIIRWCLDIPETVKTVSEDTVTQFQVSKMSF